MARQTQSTDDDDDDDDDDDYDDELKAFRQKGRKSLFGPIFQLCRIERWQETKNEINESTRARYEKQRVINF